MRKSILLGVTALSVLTLLGGCKKKEKVEDKDTRVVVKTIPAVTQTVENIAEFTSNIEPFQQNNICPSTAVRIDRILVDVGARVKKGQLLVVMDDTEYQKAAINVAQSELDYKRLKEVYDAGGIALQQLENAKNNLDIQKKTLRLLGDNIELRSPIDGVVTGRYFDPGDMFSMTPNASGAPGVLQLMEIGKLKVTIAISEQYFPNVKVGMPVGIVAEIFPDQKFEGKVSLIYPSIDPATRTFTVEVAIPNGKNVLRPGMFSRSTMLFGSHEGVMIEDIAIQKQVGSNEKYVFVIEDGVAKRRSVTVGRQVGSKMDILSGVKVGDEIAVGGMSKLFEGAEVNVVNTAK